MKKKFITFILTAIITVQGKTIFAAGNTVTDVFNDGSTEVTEIQSLQFGSANVEIADETESDNNRTEDLDTLLTNTEETKDCIFKDDEEENIMINVGDSSVGLEDFPDKVFRYFIFSNYDKDGDNILSNTEISQITDILFSDYFIKGIKDITGIENFS